VADVNEKTQAERFFQLAYSLQLAGNYDEAIALYRRSIEIHPTAKGYTFLGWALSFTGQYDRAIDECKKAIEIDPGFGNSWNDIGAYLIELGRHDEAIPYLEQALACKRYESYCYPHYNLHRIYVHKGMLARARSELERALTSNPDYQPAREALGKLKHDIN
jgi:tetratricopeptide (TPR) repeat protein